jgi:hypothetical protein
MALARRRNPNSYVRRLSLLKKLFWLYFLLLIFEGALRKWTISELSAVLLIIRDPVGIWIIWEAYRTHKWPTRWSAVVSPLTAFLAGLSTLQIVAGNNLLIVALYGLRSYLLPFPVMFIMGENLDEEDLRKLARCTLWLLIPEALLELAQYRIPASFLNRGAYEGGGQLEFIGEHVRSSGTFSFVVGAELFASLAAVFIVYGITSPGFLKRWMVWAGAFAVILSVPTLGSRFVLLQLAGILVCVAIGGTMGLSHFMRVLRVILPMVILVFLAAQLPIFSDAFESLTNRVTSANAAEGGEAGARGAIIYRFVGPLLDEIEQVTSSSRWLGSGMGADANAMVTLVGSESSKTSDFEMSRELWEFGIAGIGYGLFKLFLAIAILGPALARARDGQPLALLMSPLTVSLLFIGTPEQPTEQGFMVISAALCIAAARAPVPNAAEALQPVLLRQQLLQRRLRQRA